MGLRFIPVAALALASAAWCEKTEKAEFAYTGEPIALPARCTNELMESLGLFCPADSPCPVYLQLSSVEFIEGRLYVAGNLHTEAVTIASVLLASDDGGLSWREAAGRIPKATLDRVVFFDEKHGWAAGHVLEAGRPQDPFFLVTTDGGRFWRRRNVFAEPRAAMIQDFWFASSYSGVLLVATRSEDGERQYERFETMTGAESWMIREVSSRPIRVRRRPPRRRADWRIVPDEARDAWQVQKRTEAGWVTAAEFAIGAGACLIEEEEVLAEAEGETPKESEAAEAGQTGVAPAEDKGVFVIGSPPPSATQPAQKPAADEKPPTLKKPRT